MRRLMSVSVGLCLTLGLSGCPTTFQGNAHVQGGRAGCESKCKKTKMRMSGIVFLGEYSSACVCEVIPKAEKDADKSDKKDGAESDDQESRSSGSLGAVGTAVAALHETAYDGEPPPPLFTFGGVEVDEDEE